MGRTFGKFDRWHDVFHCICWPEGNARCRLVVAVLIVCHSVRQPPAVSCRHALRRSPPPAPRRFEIKPPRPMGIGAGAGVLIVVDAAARTRRHACRPFPKVRRPCATNPDIVSMRMDAGERPFETSVIGGRCDETVRFHSACRAILPPCPPPLPHSRPPPLRDQAAAAAGDRGGGGSADRITPGSIWRPQ